MLIILIQELTDKLNIPTNNKLLVEELESNGFFRNGKFVFVGIYYSSKQDQTVVGYPKYLQIANDSNKHESSKQILKHMEIVCRTIDKVYTDLRNTLHFNFLFSSPTNTTKEKPSSFFLAEYILRDYIKYGVYSEKTKLQGINIPGNINWIKTIHQSFPVINKSIVYHNFHKTRNISNQVSILTHLHIWVIHECVNLLRPLHMFPSLSPPEITYDFRGENLSAFVPILSSRLMETFENRNTELLKALISWCDESNFNRTHFGTVLFEIIWEYTNNAIFGNVDDTASDTPEYFINGKEYNGSGSLRPDTIYVHQSKASKDVSIGVFDAKYYIPKYVPHAHQAGRAIGAPPNSDVVKQINYVNNLKRLLSKKKVNYSNTFLFPQNFFININRYKYLGCVYKGNRINKEIYKRLGKDYFEVSKKDLVLLYEVNPSWLFKTYLFDTSTWRENYRKESFTVFIEKQKEVEQEME